MEDEPFIQNLERLEAVFMPRILGGDEGIED